MELAIFVYLIETVLEIDVIPHYGVIAGLYALYLFIVFVIAGMKWDLYNTPVKDTWDALYKPTKKPAILIIGIVFTLNLLGSFIPSKDSAYKIAAAYGIGEMYQAASQSEEVQKLTAKSLQVLEKSMGKYLEDSTEKQ